MTVSALCAAEESLGAAAEEKTLESAAHDTCAATANILAAGRLNNQTRKNEARTHTQVTRVHIGTATVRTYSSIEGSDTTRCESWVIDCERTVQMEKYDIIKKLGQGTYGTVYLCTVKATGRQCVMKRMLLRSLSDKERASAHQEAAVLRELSHPNIVAYVDALCTRAKLYLIM